MRKFKDSPLQLYLVFDPEVLDERYKYVAAYNELHAKHPDAVLLMLRNGYYEGYNDSANKISKALGLDLTKDDIHGMVSSFPEEKLDVFLPKIIRAGFRVAICGKNWFK